MANRRFPKAVAIFLALVFIVVAACIGYSFRVRKQAESCLEAVQNLRVGSSTQEEAHRTVERWTRAGVATLTGEPGYHNGPYVCDCMVFDNSGFYRLGIFHADELYVHLIYENGVLAERSVGFQQDKPFVFMGTVEAIPGFRGRPRLGSNVSAAIKEKGWEPFGRVMVVHPEPGAQGGPAGYFYAPNRGSYVLLAPTASEELHRAAFAFNLACFTSVTGCQSEDEILPSSKGLPRE